MGGRLPLCKNFLKKKSYFFSLVINGLVVIFVYNLTSGVLFIFINDFL